MYVHNIYIENFIYGMKLVNNLYFRKKINSKRSNTNYLINELKTIIRVRELYCEASKA